ncbi:MULTISPECIES: hypothetical protein [Alphaproteobacteria]|uniref:Acyltransferase n=1 Tax=Sulfitobacter sp. TCYB15 TaxID=3229275 RepID=A0AAU8C8Y8_9RHOB|nr:MULTISPECIES: hypothetical protein [unclassified Sulfitobacter]MAJ78897.1 hypothetical protein [Roseobacter sp.]MAX78541.1 hypothetical protein [Roseobacter sp.]MBU0642591.1 hypothetical protein [Alphaproteobacteria bacterium]MBU2241950.1 hypothetical protein [Alphaproteobacteria bacterium]|tara:strand:- start:3821 stop:3988 length:168 start_codon:yes stop_codon:yes gene_type:complete
MLVIAGIVAGAIWGGYLARHRKGNRLDILQYAASSAIAFGLLTYFISVVLLRIFF